MTEQHPDLLVGERTAFRVHHHEDTRRPIYVRPAYTPDPTPPLSRTFWAAAIATAVLLLVVLPFALWWVGS